MNSTTYLYGIEPETEKFITPLLKNTEFLKITANDLTKLVDNPPMITPCLILVGTKDKELSSEEIAQLFRGIFQETSIYFITENSANFDKLEYKKNGYTDAFILTLDSIYIKKTIESALVDEKNLRSFRSVRLIDLEAKTKLDFDVWVFLPANNKYLLFQRAGEYLSQEKLKKLKSENFNSVHVTLDQIQFFRNYTSKKLAQALGDENGLSKTEKSEILKESVRNLLTGVIGTTSKTDSYKQGKVILSECKKIVETFMNSSKSGEFYSKIRESLDDTSDTYSHSSNVSTFATLFSIGTKIGDPETCSMAGLLHDTGMVVVPKNIQDKPIDALTEEEEKILHSHVQASMENIIERKIILPEAVKNAVQQHHERPDGSGYPKKLKRIKICLESQIVAIADCFDYLTQIIPGKKRLSPLEAITQIHRDAIAQKRPHAFDTSITKSILQLFQKEST